MTAIDKEVYKIMKIKLLSRYKWRYEFKTRWWWV